MSGRSRKAPYFSWPIENAFPDCRYSFEFFPPRDRKCEAELWQTIRRLEPMSPDFVSVTYGAGGSTQDVTLSTVSRLVAETKLDAAAHLTCVGASRAEVDDVARSFWQAGIRHIVALRGDPPRGSGSFTPHPQGYARAAELVQGLKNLADFEVSVAAYPEGHPEAASLDADVENLKRKVDAGADRALTQFFFDPDCYLRFRDKAAAAGIDCPIVPGILPVTNFGRTVEFAEKCGASIPKWFAALFEDAQQDPATRNLIAAVAAAELCRQLQGEGVENFHFYTLNRADITLTLCRMLRAPFRKSAGAKATVNQDRPAAAL
jgi:methylenetetrahydrofolate reductase (NADPH)